MTPLLAVHGHMACRMSYFGEDLRSADVQWAAEPDEGSSELPDFLQQI